MRRWSYPHETCTISVNKLLLLLLLLLFSHFEVQIMKQGSRKRKERKRKKPSNYTGSDNRINVPCNGLFFCLTTMLSSASGPLGLTKTRERNYMNSIVFNSPTLLAIPQTNTDIKHVYNRTPLNNNQQTLTKLSPSIWRLYTANSWTHWSETFFLTISDGDGLTINSDPILWNWKISPNVLH